MTESLKNRLDAELQGLYRCLKQYATDNETKEAKWSERSKGIQNHIDRVKDNLETTAKKYETKNYEREAAAQRHLNDVATEQERRNQAILQRHRNVSEAGHMATLKRIEHALAQRGIHDTHEAVVVHRAQELLDSVRNQRLVKITAKQQKPTVYYERGRPAKVRPHEPTDLREKFSNKIQVQEERIQQLQQASTQLKLESEELRRAHRLRCEELVEYVVTHNGKAPPWLIPTPPTPQQQQQQAHTGVTTVTVPSLSHTNPASPKNTSSMKKGGPLSSAGSESGEEHSSARRKNRNNNNTFNPHPPPSNRPSDHKRHYPMWMYTT
eukprot:PhF_6_TR19092/c0_g1_i3/m.28085